MIKRFSKEDLTPYVTGVKLRYQLNVENLLLDYDVSLDSILLITNNRDIINPITGEIVNNLFNYNVESMAVSYLSGEYGLSEEEYDIVEVYNLAPSFIDSKPPVLIWKEQ